MPIHEEVAERLPQFRHSNKELVALLQEMHERELKAIPIQDRDADGTPFTLDEIDPFTFLANFNRKLTQENRRALWEFLKKAWDLESPVPSDFQGLPIANPQSSWLFQFKPQRSADHIPLLWEFFVHILHADLESLDTVLMNRCLEKKKVGLAFLTMGMFWARPKAWIAADRKNVAFARTKGVEMKLVSAEDYREWAKQAMAQANNRVVSFSHEAHLWAIGGGEPEPEPAFSDPFGILFDDGNDADRVLDRFRNVVLELQEQETEKAATLTLSVTRQTGRRRSINLNFGQWAILRYRSDGRWLVVRPASAETQVKGIGGFKGEINGNRYCLQWLTNDEFCAARMQKEFFKTLAAVREHFGDWTGSPYASSHCEPLYTAIIQPEKRERLLREGIPGISPSSEARPVWLIAPGEGAGHWNEFQRDGVVEIGWNDVGDLSGFNDIAAFRDAVANAYPDSGKVKVGRMLCDFATEIEVGDFVVAKEGTGAVLGWGVVTSEYFHVENGHPFVHRRSVDWQAMDRIEIPNGKQLPIKTLTRLAPQDERVCFLRDEHDYFVAAPVIAEPAYTIEDALKDLFLEKARLEQMLDLLRRKKNIVLQGAPGTGKTFIARRLAYLLMKTRSEARAPMVQFHQSTSYEDFVQGFRPDHDGRFLLRNGIFFDFCRQAAMNPEAEYVFIIDEINRGNLSRILGELMMLIEPDKRKRSYAVRLAYSDDESEPFHVPDNVYLIGTMNTADRSLSMVDYALRRRFAFLEMEPGFASPVFEAELRKQKISDTMIGRIRSVMDQLNDQIEKDSTSLGRGYRIGHSFFVPTTPIKDEEVWFRQVIEFEILPLVEEYWLDSDSRLTEARAILKT